MSKSIVGIAAALSFLVASSASAVAQTAPKPAAQQPAQQPGAKTPDPNEIVCEKEQDSGSRLVTNKVCMTRSQWAEQKRLNRMDIEKMQVQRPCGLNC